MKFLRKSKFHWFLLAAIMVSVTVVITLNRTHPENPTISMVVDSGDILSTVMTTGTVKPVRQLNVGAQVNGQLKKLYVQQGDKVKKGDLLAEIDPMLQASELRKSEAELQSAKAQLRSAKVLLKRYKLALLRQKKMANEGSAVIGEVEQAEADYNAQQEQLHVDEARIVQAEMAVEAARVNVSYTRILAPIDGEVLGIVTQEGQTIVSSQSAPTLMVIADMSTMRVQTRISETDILKVKTGQRLWFYVVASPQHRFDSVLGVIQNAPDEALKSEDESALSQQSSGAVYYNGTFNVNNQQRLLKTSMTAQVYIVVSEAKNVLRMPLAALGQHVNGKQYWVQVMVNGQPEMRQIEIGIRDNQFVQVVSGLKAGDRVIPFSASDKGAQK